MLFVSVPSNVPVVVNANGRIKGPTRGDDVIARRAEHRVHVPEAIRAVPDERVIAVAAVSRIADDHPAIVDACWRRRYSFAVVAKVPRLMASPP